MYDISLTVLSNLNMSMQLKKHTWQTWRGKYTTLKVS